MKGCCGCFGSNRESYDNIGEEHELVKWKEKWNKLMKKLKRKVQHSNEKQSAFSAVVCLYAHRNVIQELYTFYDRDPTNLMFFLPQLTNFLLHGSFKRHQNLECFLLDKCEKNLEFAHRIELFLRSFAHKVNYRSEMCGATATGKVELRDFRDAVHAQGTESAKSFAGYFLNILPDLRQICGEQFEVTNSKESVDDKYQYSLRLLDRLCDISLNLIAEPIPTRTPKLRDQLDEVNAEFFPNTHAYMPLGFQRHCILSCVSEESFCFSTKERVPYMLILEVCDSPLQYQHPISKPTVLNKAKKWIKRSVSRLKSQNGEELLLESHPLEMSTPGSSRAMGQWAGHHHPTAIRQNRLQSDISGMERHLRNYSPPSFRGSDHRGRLNSEEMTNIPLLSTSIIDDPTRYPSHAPEPIRPVLPPLPFNVKESSASKPITITPSNVTSTGGRNRTATAGAILTPGVNVLVNNNDISESRICREPSQSFEEKDAFHDISSDEDNANRDERVLIHEHSETDYLSKIEETEDEEETNKVTTSGFLSVGTEDPHSKILDPLSSAVNTIPTDNSSTKTNTIEFGEKSIRRPSIPLRNRPRLFTDESLEKEILKMGEGAETLEIIPEGDESNTPLPPNTPTPTPGQKSRSSGNQPQEQHAPRVIFKERWLAKESRVAARSPYSNLPGWRLMPVIVKANDDLRQEQLVFQMIGMFDRAFKEGGVNGWLKPYEIIATSPTSGVMEAVPDTISIDALKKNDKHFVNLHEFYVRHFGDGDENSKGFKNARKNFLESLAAYSVVCYLLQIKDRHNGNILVDADGHIVHIDFGFFLNNRPGNFNFERAPFKLTQEFVDLLGGERSSHFRRFRSLAIRCFMAARKRMEHFTMSLEMMIAGNEDLPCFAGNPQAAVDQFAQRFVPMKSGRAAVQYINSLIDHSIDNWRTRWYDRYQRCCVGIV